MPYWFGTLKVYQHWVPRIWAVTNLKMLETYCCFTPIWYSTHSTQNSTTIIIIIITEWIGQQTTNYTNIVRCASVGVSNCFTLLHLLYIHTTGSMWTFPKNHAPECKTKWKLKPNISRRHISHVRLTRQRAFMCNVCTTVAAATTATAKGEPRMCACVYYYYSVFRRNNMAKMFAELWPRARVCSASKPQKVHVLWTRRTRRRTRPCGSSTSVAVVLHMHVYAYAMHSGA